MSFSRQKMGRMFAALSALALLSSCSLKVKVKEEWSDFYKRPIPLGEASRTWAEIRKGVNPGEEKVKAYNASVRSSVVQIANNWSSDKDRLSLLNTVDGEVNLRVHSVNVQNVHRIAEVVPADFVKVRQGFRSETEVQGIGASLLVHQPWSEEDPMLPPSGLWYPVTAVLNLDQPTSPVLELIDPTKQGNLTYEGQGFPLSANYTAAFARDFQDRQAQFGRLSALISFEKYADRTGLKRVTAFDPAKEPCILIHGIYSSPATWDDTLNRLYAVKEIRERYEFWTYGYPTGAPIPFMAAELRESIQKMIGFRQANGAKEEELTLVGHSMGGLLSRAMTRSSGDAEWNQFFTVPIDQLEVSESDREILRRMVYFEPIPQIDRVIFCATPHQGSKLAENPAAQLVSDLIHIPSQLLRLSTEMIAQKADVLTPLGMEIAMKRKTSIDQLSAKMRRKMGILDKPLNPAVTFHSIIGCHGGPHVPLEKASDGIVAYTSASIEGVASEVVIHQSPHGVHRTEGGIQEIIRILELP